MTTIEFINLALIIALIIFSAWCFYLRFKANRVCTIKDLLLAFVTGGALAVTTLVFGVTGEIMDVSNSIKADTGSIRTTLEGGTRPEAADSAFERVGTANSPFEGPETADPQINPGNEKLDELLKINQQQTQVLRRLLGQTEGLVEKVDLTNQLIERILAVLGSNKEITAMMSGPQLYIQLDLFCSIPRGDEPSNCVIRPSEG